MAKKPEPPTPGKPPKKGEPPRAADQTGAADTPSADAKMWQARLTAGNKEYDKWAQDYEVKRLEQYYEGKHWRGLAETEAAKKYVINLVFATIETQLPSLLFSKPKVVVEARPDAEEEPGSDLAARATLIRQTLQTFIDNRDLRFGFVTTLALRDAYPRFAMVEVGYTADFIDNPNANKPLLKDDNSPLKDSAGEPVAQASKLPKKESLYIRRIAPQAFRASNGKNVLQENDWVAYYSWQYLSDVKANKAYANTANMTATGSRVNMDEDSDHDRDPDRSDRTGMVKIWKIWDLRAKKRIVMVEGHLQILQTKAFTHLPLAGMKFFERADSYYPLPPIYNWLAPQDELNESREMARVHRRRAVRRYMRDPRVSVMEFEKLEAGEDMVCIEVPNPTGAIVPIQDAPLGQESWTQLAATKEDYQEITGVSGEARGVPQADTATQANIINVRAQVRESSARLQVANWLGDIVRLMLLTVREQMQLPMMVKNYADPFAPASVSAAGETAKTWREIQKGDIGGLAVDITIDVATLSPVAQDAKCQQWENILNLLSKPPIALMLMTPNPAAPNDPSPLLRKTLMLEGIDSDQEIREIWRVGQEILKQAAQSAAAAAGQAHDKAHTAYSFKELSDPLVRQAFINAEGLASYAATLALQPGAGAGLPAPPGGGSGGQPQPPGPTTGTPAVAAGGPQ